MKVLLFTIFSSVFCVLSGMSMDVIAQDVPISDESINLERYPLKFDAKLGIARARLGDGSLFQMEVTLVELPAGGSSPPHRHLTEEMVYIVSGEGYTSMWTRPGEKAHQYEWSVGDLLSPSMNTWHQHHNASPETPARFVSLSTTPLSENILHNVDLTKYSEFVFEDRWQIGITRQPRYKIPGEFDMEAGHHLPDLAGRHLPTTNAGRWGITIRPEGDMAGNYILEMFVREYHSNEMGTGLPSRGDKHPWEVVYLGLAGEGSAILKNGDEPARQVNWGKNHLFIVKADEAHHMGALIGSGISTPYPRLMQIKPAGYFDGIGKVGNTVRTTVTEDDVLIIGE